MCQKVTNTLVLLCSSNLNKKKLHSSGIVFISLQFLRNLLMGPMVQCALKTVNIRLNIDSYSYLKTFRRKSNVVHFFYTSVN
jgi:hypothetical protein